MIQELVACHQISPPGFTVILQVDPIGYNGVPRKRYRSEKDDLFIRDRLW